MKMKNFFLLAFTFVSVLAFTECLGGMRSGSGAGFKSAKYTSNPKIPVYNGGGYAQQNTNKDATTPKESATPRKGSGMSAWGIIAIVLSVILVSVGGYYVFIFYPLLCKKERNYDVMELSSV